MNGYGYNYFNEMNVLDGMPYPTLTYLPPNFKENESYQNNIMNQKNITSPNNKELAEPYLAFIRGNSFTRLYDPYKNYKPQQLDPKNEKEALLYQLLAYQFLITDLNLYLDTNPEDNEMFFILKKYLNIKKQIEKKYENMYGPLTIEGIEQQTKSYDWKNGPWPWEGV